MNDTQELRLITGAICFVLWATWSLVRNYKKKQNEQRDKENKGI